METYRILSYEEAREAKIYKLYSCLVGPDGFECTLTEPEDRTWGRDLLPVVERLNEYAARIRELEAQLAKIAHIAHNDGLDNLTEAEALGRICILSLAWRDRKEE